MEKDKSILTLSAAGIGLLVTLLTTVGPHSWIEAIFYALAFAGFTFSALTAVRIFDRNADYLLQLANDKDESDPRLRSLDRRLLKGFLFGVAFTVLIAVSSAIARYSHKGFPMSEKEEKAPVASSDGQRRSLDSLGSLRPPGSQPLNESVDGLGKLKGGDSGQKTNDVIPNQQAPGATEGAKKP